MAIVKDFEKLLTRVDLLEIKGFFHNAKYFHTDYRCSYILTYNVRHACIRRLYIIELLFCLIVIYCGSKSEIISFSILFT